MEIVHVAPSANEYCSYRTLYNCQKNDAETLVGNGKFIKADLIIIDDNYNRKGNREGYWLLKLLRLHQIHAHCILYSFLPDSYYYKTDHNRSILLSEGVTFVRMPQIIDENFIKSLMEKKCPDDLSEFFLKDYQDVFSNNRHFHANWWGPLRIMEYLKRADKIKNEDVIYAADSQSKKYKHSYKGLVLRYMKSLRENSVWESHIPEIQKKNKKLKSDCYGLEEIIQKIGSLHCLDKKVDQAIELFNEKRKEIANDIASNNEEIKSLGDKKERGSFQKEEIIEGLRNELKERNPKILYLDDKAESGWSYVLKKLIYGNDNTGRFIVESDFTSVTDHDEKGKEIVEKARKEEFDIVIIDLRLKDEKGDVKPAELSGIKLLNALRNKKTYLPCPILVFSASNKSDVVAETFRSGADAFWRKEGIDENNDPEPSIRVDYTCDRIRELLKTINRLCGEEYRFLYHDMLDFCLLIGDETKHFWWEDAKNLFGRDDNYVPLTKQEVADWVWMSHEQLKEFLVKDNAIKLAATYGQICMHLHKVLETIHDPKGNGIHKEYNNGLWDNHSSDWKNAISKRCNLNVNEIKLNTPFFHSFWVLNRIRNNQAHNIGLLDIEFSCKSGDDFKTYFSRYASYLTANINVIFTLFRKKSKLASQNSKATNSARTSKTTAKEEMELFCPIEKYQEPIKDEIEVQNQEALSHQDNNPENRLKGSVFVAENQKRIVVEHDACYYVIDKKCENYDLINNGDTVSFRLKTVPNFTIFNISDESPCSFSATFVRLDSKQSTVQLKEIKADCNTLNSKIIKTNVIQDGETHEVAPSIGTLKNTIFLNDGKALFMDKEYAECLWDASFTFHDGEVTLSSLTPQKSLFWCKIDPKDLSLFQESDERTINFDLKGWLSFYAIDVQVEEKSMGELGGTREKV